MNKNYVFQIGIICAGSTSLCEALNILGIPSLHYQGPDYREFETNVISENIKSNRRLFYPYDEQFTGFFDFNGHHHHQLLYKMYPESKFIYTWREYDSWMESSLRLSQNRWRIGEPIYVGAGPNQLRLINSNIGQDMPKKICELKMKDLQDYYQDNQVMIEFFKNNPRFLQMKICDSNGDGWEKLCDFLEMDIPDVEFPNIPSYKFIFPQSQQITATYEG